MVNLPGGHQQSLMPETVRSSPAFAPLKAEGATDLTGSSTGVTGSTRLQPRTADASRMSEQTPRANDMGTSPSLVEWLVRRQPLSLPEDSGRLELHALTQALVDVKPRL